MAVVSFRSPIPSELVFFTRRASCRRVRHALLPGQCAFERSILSGIVAWISLAMFGPTVRGLVPNASYYFTPLLNQNTLVVVGHRPTAASRIVGKERGASVAPLWRDSWVSIAGGGPARWGAGMAAA